MAKILNIQEFDGTVLVDLISDTGACVFAGEGGRRPLKTGNELITRAFRFRITAASKVAARTSANTFIAGLRQAVRWNEDSLQSNSIFLGEAADGETLVRSLIINFAAAAAVDGSAIDAYQTMNTELFVDVALTVQNFREEASKSAPLFTGSASGGIGSAELFHTSNHTARSRINMEIDTPTIIDLSPDFPATVTKLWAGIYRRVGADFNHLWSADDISFGLETTTATVAGSYSTLVTDTNFTDTDMKHRGTFVVSTIYGGVNVGHAVGEFVALLRYKTSAIGTYLVRGGTGYTAGTVAYNETRLLDDSQEWRMMSLGVVKFPPSGLRQETATIFGIDNVALGLEAQRLSGSGHLYMDTITLIPYEQFIHVDNLYMTSSSDSRIVTHENGETEAFSEDVTNLGFGTILENKNWGFPTILDTYNVMVVASEREEVHELGDTIRITDFDIYKAYEAYHA